MDSAIHWIVVIFQLPQKGIKGNGTIDIELAKDKVTLNKGKQQYIFLPAY